LPKAFAHIRQAGDRIAQRARGAPGEATASSSYLCPDDELKAARNLPELRRLRRLFGGADADANYFQERLLGSWSPGLPWPKGRTPVRPGMLLWFASAVPLATLCFELFTEYGKHVAWLALYIVAIAGPLLAYLIAVRHGDWQARYQDHRALAEGLRVQFFWAASGVTSAVSDSYLHHQTGTLGWIRLALRGPALDGLAAALSVRSPDSAFVRKRWMHDQVAYFKREGQKQEIASAAMRRLTSAAIACLAVLALALLFAALANGGSLPELEPGWATELSLVVLGTLPALAAFFVIIAEARAYEEHAHAYAQSLNLFAAAERRAAQLDPADVSGWRDLLLELGQEALTENAVWIATHRSRPVANRIG
jgi:hypothetical protein